MFGLPSAPLVVGVGWFFSESSFRFLFRDSLNEALNPANPLPLMSLFSALPPYFWASTPSHCTALLFPPGSLLSPTEVVSEPGEIYLALLKFFFFDHSFSSPL